MTLRENKQRKNSQRAAFTLMEMLVVVAIIVVLAGAGTLGYMKIMEDARRDTAKRGCKTLEQACQTYKLNFGSYPDNLQVLAQNFDGTGALVDQNALRDPWGHDYNYEPANLHPQTMVPRISSGGSQNVAGAISNW